MLNVLLLEDNTSLAEEMVSFLADNKIILKHCTTLAELMDALSLDSYPLVILDRLLPEGDALDHIDKVHAVHKGKTIVLSALGMSNDRIKGLNSGADYYLAKPVDLSELIAVIRSLTRPEENCPAQLEWRLSATNKSLCTPNSAEISLTGSEFNLIETLMQQPNTILKREEIVSLLGFELGRYDIRRLDTLVCRLRGKIRNTSGDNIPIHTFSKVGYAWKTESQAES